MPGANQRSVALPESAVTTKVNTSEAAWPEEPTVMVGL